MCGIFAFIKNSSLEYKEELIYDSSELKKRGPDSHNTYSCETGIFDFYRLSINDTGSSGNQPMLSEDKNIVLMCNGEIYNHRELEVEYDLPLSSEIDCEVILRLYEHILSKQYKKDKNMAFVQTVQKLYGVFAIVLRDGDSVFVARDRIGVRFLYFGLTKNQEVVVASVPNPLVPMCISVSHFPPGTVAVHNTTTARVAKNLTVFTYLYTDEITVRKNKIKRNSGQRLHDALVEAVKLRLMSDRPMGCLLSGGLDSSLVASILTKFLGGKNVRTYSVGMVGSTDLYYARKVADYLGTDHTEVIFTPEDGISLIPIVIRTLGSYDITTIRASICMYIISAFIAMNTKDKVIFSGEGSDEILEGYLYFKKAPTPVEGALESVRLTKNLHMYDVLRADRCISSNGLEPRVPFLDRKVVNVCLSIPDEEKCPQNGVEKYILRKAFEGGYLPDEVLWRQKEALSDGVSGVQKSWYTCLQEYVDSKIENFDAKQFPSKEAQYYKEVFDGIFPEYKVRIPYWLPKWCGDVKDPSARVLNVYNK